MPYDPTGFKPLAESPAETSFSFSTLQTRPFNLDKIPEHKLPTKTDTLPPPTVIRLPKPQQVPAAAIDLKKWPPFTNADISIRGMTTDTAGTIWLSTFNGIYSYDGNELTNYLPGLYTNGLEFDKNHNLWCMTVNNLKQNALLRIDFKNNTINKALLDSFAMGPLSVLKLAGDGQIWISCQNGQPPLVLNPSSLSYKILTPESGLKSNYYYQHGIDEQNRIWLPSSNGIEVIDQKENKIYHIGRKDGLMMDSVTNIYPAGRDTIWIALRNGMQCLNLKTGTLRNYKIKKEDFRTWALLQDGKGHLWIGANDGLYILNPKDNTLRAGEEPVGSGQSPAVAFSEDKSGEITFISISPDGSKSSLFSVGQYGKTTRPLADEGIICAAEDTRENLWVGTDKGVFIVDSARKSYRKLDISDGLTDQFVQYIGHKDGKIVITTNGGYNIYDPQKNQLLRVGKDEGLLSDIVYSVTTDANGNEWIAGSDAGIFKYEKDSHLALRLNTAGGLNGNNVGQTVLLKDNRILSVTTENGPAIIDPEKNTIQTIEKNLITNAENINKSIFTDAQGRIWLIMYGTAGAGLYMMDPELKTITHFTTQNGLAGDNIASVLEYKGAILVNSGEKINILTPPELSSTSQWTVSVLSHSENLKKTYTSYVSDAITKRGNYLYGDAGLSVIYGIAANTTTTRSYIKRISVMGKDMDFTAVAKEMKTDTSQKETSGTSALTDYTRTKKIRWTAVSGPYHLGVNLSLPYNQNTIQLQYGEINPTRSDEAEYAYLLEGIDNQWSFTKNPHTENYLNLAPGNYTFKVAVRASSGRWGPPATFSFTIRPPWYATWWAYVLYGLLAALGIWLIVNLQKRSVIAKERQRSDIREANLKASAENERRKNLEVISDMGRDITGSLSFKKIIDTVYGHVNTLMDASVFGIGVYNKEKNQLLFPATKERGDTLPSYSYNLGDPTRPAVWCFKNEKEVFSNNFGKEYSNYIPELGDVAAGDHVESLIYVPLLHKEKCLGVLTAQSFKKDAYNDYHINILENLATYAAVAIDNADAYRNLQATQHQLIQSEKMASLGELTAGIAHEIQNPLNFVNNFSEVSSELVEELKIRSVKLKIDDAEVDELLNDLTKNLEKINHHGKRADAIVKGMLQHSRGTTGHREMTDINALCDEYLRLSYHGLRAKDKSFNADYKSDFDPAVGKVNVVPQDIGRVVLNLLNNAFYAVNEKKKKSNGAFYPSVSISTKKESNQIEIMVKDNGSGIQDTLREKIFQPFFTTKPAGKGTGLGLSLSYDIVKAHGGDIKIFSGENETPQPGQQVISDRQRQGVQGTTFVVSLPV